LLFFIIPVSLLCIFCFFHYGLCKPIVTLLSSSFLHCFLAPHDQSCLQMIGVRSAPPPVCFNLPKGTLHLLICPWLLNHSLAACSNIAKQFVTASPFTIWPLFAVLVSPQQNRYIKQLVFHLSFLT
jgi:hypothetical protein